MTLTHSSNTLTAAGGTFAAAAITGTTIDASTDFTIGTTVITDDSIVMTPSSSDTVTIAGATHGILNITTVDAAGTAADVNIDADGEIVIDAADAAGSIFKIAGTAQLSIIDGSILPTTDNDIDLGSSSYQFKDAYIHGTLEADAITIGGTNVVSGSLITTLGTISAGVWQGTAIASGYIAADAITAAKIADDAIDSEHYTDGSIDTAHIADDAVTLAKMASGTDGNIISYDASGNPVAIATGTDGQVLTSTGAGSPPAFEDAASGGASQANQAAVEAETNEDTYVPPDLLRHAPGMAKGWCQYQQTGTHGIVSSYNVASVTDRGVGQTDVTWTTNFSQADYAVSVTPIATGSGSHEISEHAVDKVRTYTRDINDNSVSDAFIDVETCCIAWGDQ